MAASGARDFGSVRKLPSGRFQARYRDPEGERRNAPVTFTTKKAASAWLADTQSDIERGRWKSPEQIAAEEAAAATERADTLTIAQLGDVWLESIASENHRYTSAGRLRRFIIPELGDIPVTELTRERCEQWHRAMETTLCPNAPTQRVRTYAALHAMLKLAVHQDLIPVSPLRIKGLLTDRPVREPQTATPAEVDQLAAAMPEYLAMAVQLAAWCGLRAGEILGLQIDDITVDRATPVPLEPVVRLQLRRHIVQGRGTGAMTIEPGTKASDGKPESVVVPPHLHVALWRHVETHGRHVEPRWLFPGTRTVDMPAGYATLDKRFREAKGKCDLEHLTLHDLRRTGNTIAAAAGATLGEMKQLLRHRTSEAAERYIVAARGADVDLARRMSQQAANPLRSPGRGAPAAGDVTADPEWMTAVSVTVIDSAITAVEKLHAAVLESGDEALLTYLTERIEELAAVVEADSDPAE
ncbi:tyrosine-type recombinase/integrase [Mycolicibacterium mageritense]|uniref:tyrosine-type recombinase/integrase n=1 Tax=Mycolicibacterium mageritense TaxID=53462 RepID=UPI0023F127D0|nr:site-specific integrase [Mycolicibacterium mageritense]